jgi:hypothetical protein
MTKTFLLALCVIFSSLFASKNIKKLAPDEIAIKNTLSDDVALELLFSPKCEHCYSKETTVVKIKANEALLLEMSHKKFIELRSIGKEFFVYLDKFDTIKNTITIKLEPQKRKFSLPPFKDIIITDPGYENIKNQGYCRRLPVNVSPSMFLEYVEILYEYARELIAQKKTIKSPIPKIMHYIWFGPAMPILYQKWQKEWKKQHSEWKIICWTEDLIKREFPNGLYNQTTFNYAKLFKNYAKMSDVLRYEILYRFGGLYIDSDTINFENIENLHNSFDFYTGLEEIHYEVELGNGIIGSQKDHPILKYCMEKIKEYETVAPDLSLWDSSNWVIAEVNDTLITTGPVMFTHAFWFQSNKNNNRDVVLPSQFFYPCSKIQLISYSKHLYFDSWIDELAKRNNAF